MKMITKPIGLYVHIPLCIRKCNYCDFCSHPIDTVEWRNEYIQALCAEMECYRGKGISLNSIFFGGGTPSLLTVDELSLIVSKIRDIFILSDDIEFTVEANPKTVDKEKIEGFISLGVNRISLGLQSIHDNEMKILGRVHNYDDFVESYNVVKSAGVENVNVDLMYGIPLQTMSSFEKTLDEIIRFSPEHISLYGLIIEDETPFGREKAKLNLPSDDTECDMYDLACKRLREAGYDHYEISNYARDGHYCRHNMKYWQEEEYIGIGVAAHSYYCGRRFGNTNDISAYLMGDRAKYDHGEVVSPEDEAYEFVMLGLRLGVGISLSEYYHRFGIQFLDGREAVVKSLASAGYLKIADDRLFLTERGFYVSNLILNELI